MNKSESIDKLSEALAKAQGAIHPAQMNAENPFLHNRYADLGSIIEASRKPLADNGLAVSQHPMIESGKLTISTLLSHASGQWLQSEIALPISEEKGLSLAQSMGKVITYLRRYAYASIIGVYADEDADGNDDRTQARPARQQVQKAQPAAASNAPTEQKPAAETSSSNGAKNGAVGQQEGSGATQTSTPTKDAGKPQNEAPKRPYDPETLKKGLIAKAKTQTSNSAPGETQAVAAALSKLLGGEDQRHRLIAFLSPEGKEGLKDNPNAWVRALHEWLKPVYDRQVGQFLVDEMAAKEAQTAYDMAVLPF